MLGEFLVAVAEGLEVVLRLIDRRREALGV
jgi:hypothetical protein